MKTIATVPAGTLILAVCLYIAAIDNMPFWAALSQRLDLYDPQALGFSLTFYAVMAGILALLVLLIGHRLILKPLLITLLLISAIISHFNGIGVVFDENMIRNVLETVRDRNVNEATELVSASLLWHLFIYGLLPSAVVLAVKVRSRPMISELGSRAGYALGVAAVIAALIMLNFKYFTYFSRENRDLRLTLTPHYPISSAVKLVKRSRAANGEFIELGDDAVITHTGRKRVGIMVVGETSRWDHWSINGYQKKTNPLLEQKDIISFSNAWSCGTSTAYSVPCMFSFLDQANYSPGIAKNRSNVLDVLKKSGVEVIWRDNNSSCKGVCERIRSENFHHDFDENSPYYHEGEYIDEILLAGLDELIESSQSDMLIVLHTMGSHGPAYYKRYPERFARFQPACETNSPHECSNEAVSNAYDNTILYTDYFLAKTIEFLRARSNRYDTFMLYASDHGESLGENGIYLHGLPYMLAPEAQKHVPMIAWLSESLKASQGLSGRKVVCNEETVSHDNLSHTLLGLFDVKTSLYQQALDLFSADPAHHRFASTGVCKPGRA